MTDIQLTCIGDGVFKASSPADLAALVRFRIGDVMTAKVSRNRNPKFHAKFFALLSVGYDAFNPTNEYKGRPVHKNYDRFREDVTIMAGYYDLVPTLTGQVRPKAQSISFAKMGQDEFEVLYSEVANVILEKVLTNYSSDDLDNVVQQIMGFV